MSVDDERLAELFVLIVIKFVYIDYTPVYLESWYINLTRN